MGQLTSNRIATQAKEAIEKRLYGETFGNLFNQLHAFVPYSSGSRQDLIRMAFEGVGQVFPLLEKLLEQNGKTPVLQVIKADQFCKTQSERHAAEKLKFLFDRYGSDKATAHNYHLVYGPILTRLRSPTALLEVGLGTNNQAHMSHMGKAGRPGASLRAFRDYLDGCQIYGADIDKEILFQEERIETYFVDQTDIASFRELEDLGNFDVIIDDGLHSPSANLAVLLLGIRRITVGGWIIIEDIRKTAQPFWKVVGAILPDDFRPTIVDTPKALLFVVERFC